MASGSIKSSMVAPTAIAVNQDTLQVQQAAEELFVSFLDDIHRRLNQAADDEQVVHQALDELFGTLRQWKLAVSAADWTHYLQRCRQHPLKELIHQDPFTFRAFSKPRGYAGDAVMMDYIYGREEAWEPPAAEPLGAQIFNFTTSAPASEGVRCRRAAIARRIDRLADEKPRPHILSIAAGHLREAELSATLRRGRAGRMLALDADAESLEEVSRRYGRFGVETLPTTFRALLTNRCDVGQFDLVYSTGLFDYLDQRIGQRLVTTMFQMLRPGGRLVVANFLPGVRDIGYMEAYMDWHLIYRDRREMIELTMNIPEEEIQDVRLFSEENLNIIFLEVSRS